MSGEILKGYPCDLLVDKSDLTERIICGVCNLVLRDAVQHECGHRFCSSCAKKLQCEMHPQLCPRCPSDSQDAPIRTNHEDICPHAEESCTACGRHMKHEELQNHSLHDCIVRTITCRWCNTELIHKNMKEHNGVCPKMEILCEICKKSKLPREEMKLHKDPETGDCPLLKRCCKFQMVGCEFTAPQEQMSEHLHNNMQEHLNLLMGDYIIVKNKLSVAESICAEMNQAFHNPGIPEEGVAQFRKELSFLQDAQGHLKEQFNELQNTSDITRQNLKSVDLQMKENTKKIQSLSYTTYFAKHVWQVTNYSQKRRDAISCKQRSFFSQYFYTSPHGYRARCRIYLNGDGMGRGTHISIFFVIMKGKYDGLLDWPFRQTVKFMLMDQNNQEHVVDGFRPDERSSSFRRPTNDMNIAMGCPKFIPIAQLEASPNPYIKDDTMFIKIIVDPLPDAWGF